MIENSAYFDGQLLIAMPQMSDPRFSRAVIYMCAHSADGAMGLVVNKLVSAVTFTDLLGQLGIKPSSKTNDIHVHFGGPVESGRGFVLHSDDYIQDATLRIKKGIALTATTNVLRAIALGDGPKRSLFALGYAGWAAGQLDAEIQANGWLNVSADNDLVFLTPPENKWKRAMEKLGIDHVKLSDVAGHA